MAPSAFDDKGKPPDSREVARTLGKSAALWDRLIAYVAGHVATPTELWSFGGAKSGWSLRLKSKERVILYLTPQAGRFLVGVVLGEKAVEAAHQRDLPRSVLSLIDGAPRYPEGRGIRLSVGSRDELSAAQHLADVKLSS
jgi:hypothetical protein